MAYIDDFKIWGPYSMGDKGRKIVIVVRTVSYPKLSLITYINMSEKICKKCNLMKNKFRLSYSKNKSKCWESNTCYDCYKEYRKNYCQKNRKILNAKMTEYRDNNSEKIASHKKKYYKNNKEKVLKSVKKYVNKNYNKVKVYYKKYRKNNAEKISKRMKLYAISNKEKINVNYRKKYKNNPCIKIRQILSSRIRSELINNGFKKKNSILKFLNYSIKELKQHIENQFESWMNWKNWGTYNKGLWDDNDQSTWTWQIDHIIPHSTFKYTSMEDEEFKKCWSLSNLRPYSAKQNLLDSNRRKNHE